MYLIWFNLCIKLLWMVSNLIQMMQNYCEFLSYFKLYLWGIKIILVLKKKNKKKIILPYSAKKQKMIVLPSQQFFLFFFWDRIYWCHCEKYHILNIIIIISAKRRFRDWNIGGYGELANTIYFKHFSKFCQTLRL